MADNSPTPAAEGPQSAETVRKTPPKSPREIVLEKKVSTLEDEVSGLKGAVAGINDFMATLGLGQKPVKVAAAPAAGSNPEADKRGFMEGLMDDLLG